MLGLGIALLPIGLNGLFALSELAVVSARKARLKTMAENGQTGAGTPLRLAGNPEGKTSFGLPDNENLRTTLSGEIGHVSFFGLGRAFVDFRMREGRKPEPYTSPSGLWTVAEYRTD